MWGFFVGVLIGAAQIFTMKSLINMVLKHGKHLKFHIFPLFILKAFIPLFIFGLMARLSLQHMLWTAAGAMLTPFLFGIGTLIKVRKH